MIDFFNSLQFGRVAFAHGKDWQIVMPLQNGYALAVPVGVDAPYAVTLIREEQTTKEKTE